MKDKNGVERDELGHWVGSGNARGTSTTMAEIRAMLDSRHRNADNLRFVFERLKDLAMGDYEMTKVDEDGVETKVKLRPDAAFMKMYLERLLGPPKEHEDELDLSDAPAEVLAYLRERFKTN